MVFPQSNRLRWLFNHSMQGITGLDELPERINQLYRSVINGSNNGRGEPAVTGGGLITRDNVN